MILLQEQRKISVMIIIYRRFEIFFQKHGRMYLQKCTDKQYTCNNFKNLNLETDYCSLRSAAVCPKNCDVACRKKSATISTKDAGSSMKNAFDTASYPMIHEEYKKSSYRDISKDFCVSNITVAYEALNCSIS